MIRTVVKKSGEKQAFELNKIAVSIEKAGDDTREYGKKEARGMMKKIEEELEQIKKQVVSVEEIRNVVEPLIAKAGYFKTARHYILYSNKEQVTRNKNKPLEPQLTDVALEVMRKRYLMTDMEGKVLETPGEMFLRVAKHMAKAEVQFNSKDEQGVPLNGGAVAYWAEKFCERMVNWKFVCAGKAMFEAGNPGGTGQLSSCFVLPIEDNIGTIFKTLGDAAVVHKNNGGTGFNFSKIRPHGDKVKNVPKAASGPVDFLKAYSAALGQILQGAKRQGANIAILNCDHPDIEEFIKLKEQDGTIKNFNISVGVTNAFMEAVEKDKWWELKNPRNGEVWKTIKARELFDLIAESAWRTGDPGLAFLDRLEEDNPTPSLGRIEATNPCITGDALVPTNTGLVRFDELIKQIQSGKEVRILVDGRLNDDGDNHKIVVAAVKTGEKKVFLVETIHGYKLKATANHKLMTLNGWKEVMALTDKETVLIQAGPGLWSHEYELQKLVKLSEDYPASYPRRVGGELGEVLGYFIGDGSVRWDEKDSYAYLTFGLKRTELSEYFSKILFKWGIKITERRNNGRTLQLWSHKKSWSHFLVDCGVKPVYSSEKRVPVSIYRMPLDVVKGFLRGLFSADGTVGFVEGKSSYVWLTSKSKILLEEVQLILLNLGIFSKIYNRSRNFRANLFPKYVTKGGEVKTYGSDGLLFELEIAKDQVVRYLDEIGFIGNLNRDKIAKLRNKVYYRQKFEDRIKKITELGVEAVFDLTEPETHSFIANGMVVHNCGEIPLLPYESCNLTSIVLSNHLIEKNGKWEIDWTDLEKSIKLGIRFLDDMIEVNTYALDQIRQMVKEGNRRIGLGVMGFAHMLYRMGIPYDSDEAVRLSERIAKFMRQKAEEASLALGRERGSFPNFDVSIYAGTAERYRNCALLMIAPTGTTSLIANASSGVEPVFSLVTVRRSFNEDSRKNAPTKEFTIVDPEFSRAMRSIQNLKLKCQNHNSKIKTEEELLDCISRHGLADVGGLPKTLKSIFVTTHEIEPEWHIKIQAAWQKWIDNSVSKTINFANSATVEEVKNAYLLGWKLGLKGITIYRDGSKMDQVLNIKGKESKLSADAQVNREPCPECGGKTNFSDGCVSCPSCGWSKCSM